jgi:hypothetical protein
MAKGKKKTRMHMMALFPRLREIREQRLGWEVSDIVRRIPEGRPSGSTIHRLEGGEPIRVTNARRVFDVLNAALNNTLDARKELKMVKGA